jgi:hypothetical protein
VRDSPADRGTTPDDASRARRATIRGALYALLRVTATRRLRARCTEAAAMKHAALSARMSSAAVGGGGGAGGATRLQRPVTCARARSSAPRAPVRAHLPEPRRGAKTGAAGAAAPPAPTTSAAGAAPAAPSDVAAKKQPVNKPQARPHAPRVLAVLALARAPARAMCPRSAC